MRTSPDMRARVDALRAVGNYEGARNEALEAASMAGASPVALGEALVELGRGEADLGHHDAAAHAWLRALSVEPGTQGVRLAASGELAAVTLFLGVPYEAAAFAVQAVALAALPDNAADEAAIALAHAALVAADAGDDDMALDRIERARSVLAERSLTVREARAAVAVDAAAGRVHRGRGRYEAALIDLGRALTTADERLGPNSIEVAFVLNETGVCCKFVGRFAEASAAYARAQRVLERVGTGDHPDLAGLYHNIGGLHHARGNHAAAEAPARLAVELRERALGSNHPLVVRDRAAWAAILDALGRSDEAAQILHDSIARLGSALGPDHPEVAVNLNNLAAILGRKGDLDQAATLYAQALGIKERSMAPPTSVAITLNNLASVRRRQGRHIEAERDYRRALQLLDGTVAPDHPTIVAIRGNLRVLERSRARPIPLQPGRRGEELSDN